MCVVHGHKLQNPEVVALKEDIKRTGKKLKLWERELEDRKTKLADQHSKVAKLEQDLEQVNAGKPLCCLDLHARGTCSLALAILCSIPLVWHQHVQGREPSLATSPKLQMGSWCGMHGSACCCPCTDHAGYVR